MGTLASAPWRMPKRAEELKQMIIMPAFASSPQWEGGELWHAELGKMRKWQLPPVLRGVPDFQPGCRHFQVHRTSIFHSFLEHFLTLLCRKATHERFFFIKSKHKKKISQICWSGCFPVICHLNYITTIFQTLN